MPACVLYSKVRQDACQAVKYHDKQRFAQQESTADDNRGMQYSSGNRGGSGEDKPSPLTSFNGCGTMSRS